MFDRRLASIADDFEELGNTATIMIITCISINANGENADFQGAAFRGIVAFGTQVGGLDRGG